MTSVLIFEIAAKDTYGMTVSSTYAVPLPQKLVREDWEKNFPTYEDWRLSKVDFTNSTKSKLEAKGPELFPGHTGRGWRYEATIKSTAPLLKI